MDIVDARPFRQVGALSTASRADEMLAMRLFMKTIVRDEPMGTAPGAFTSEPGEHPKPSTMVRSEPSMRPGSVKTPGGAEKNRF